MDEAPVLDLGVTNALRTLTPAGEPDVLAEVLNLFLAEVPPRLLRLRNAWAGANIQEVQRTAHSLKGSAGNIGARRLYAVCSELDEKARNGDLPGAGPLISAAGAEFDKVEAEIRRLLASG
jgi:two-component system, sensor histidine kinase and response regulator